MTAEPTSDISVQVDGDGTGSVYLIWTHIGSGVAYGQPVTAIINGEAGDDGQRGSIARSVEVPEKEWSDLPEHTTDLFPDGEVVPYDTVTQWNEDDAGPENPGFVESRFWNGSEWIVTELVVDGDVIVLGSIRGEHIVASASITTPRLEGGEITGESLVISSSVVAGANDNVAVIDGTGDDRIYAGNSDSAKAPFRVTSSGDLHTKGNTYIDGNTEIGGNTTIDGETEIGGNTTIGGTTTIGGDTYIGGNVDITGSGTIGENMTVKGQISATQITGDIVSGKVIRRAICSSRKSRRRNNFN